MSKTVAEVLDLIQSCRAAFLYHMTASLLD